MREVGLMPVRVACTAVGATVALLVTADAAKPTLETFPGKNGLIAFDEPGRDGGFNIWVMNADGTHRRQLTHGSISKRAPAWSPNGKLLAFTTGLLAAGPALFPTQIWVTKADGSGLRRVVAAKVAPGTSAWSPDGKRLMFYSLSRSGGIYVVRLGGGKARKLVACRFCSFPSWSPDGRRIAFDRYILSTVSDEIDVVNANGRGLRTIGRVPGGGVTDLDWSPSGHELAFATLGSPQKPGLALEVVGSNGQGLRTVAAGADGGVSWSPDGTLIAFVRGAAIDVVTVDGKSERTLTSLSGPFGQLIAWQPVGKH